MRQLSIPVRQTLATLALGGDGAAVYRVYGSGRELLYVGTSTFPIRRLISHETRSDWFAQASRATIRWYGSREGALDAEAYAICREKPAFNKTWATSRVARIMRHTHYAVIRGTGVGIAVASWMNARGMTLDQAAQHCGIPKNVLTTAMAYEFSVSKRTIAKLAEVTGLPVAEREAWE